jgi:hypothetical protein
MRSSDWMKLLYCYDSRASLRGRPIAVAIASNPVVFQARPGGIRALNRAHA